MEEEEADMGTAWATFAIDEESQKCFSNLNSGQMLLWPPDILSCPILSKAAPSLLQYESLAHIDKKEIVWDQTYSYMILDNQ